VLAIAYIGAWLWRYCWLGDWFEWYARFDTRLSGLILGCLIARVDVVKPFPAWPGIALLLLACPLFRFYDASVPIFGLSMVEVGAAIAILGRPPQWLGSTVLAYIGRLSYGIYLWHYPVARIFRDEGYPWQISLAVTSLCAFAMAALSYHTVEAWFRRWMSRRRQLTALARAASSS
jgi:peptidoglycan/LPS O-acetylase OafA/YrhL